MASTYVNNLRLNEMATGDASGSWGTNTNTNLEIIGQATAWGTRAIANASTDNITIADGALDADRCLGLKLTGGGQACTVTLLPNTSSKTWFMYNATSYTLTFTCGSGANVAILAGETKVIATDGLGSGGVVHDLLTAVNLAGTTKTAALTNAGALSNQGTVTVGVDDTGYDVQLFGATSGKSLLWDESADSLIVTGSTSNQGTVTVGVDDTGYDVKLFGATSGAYMLWDESADDLKLVGAAGLTVAGDIDVDGTTNLDIVDIDGAVQIDATFTSGVDGQGYDTKFFGDTASAYMLWDTSADDLILGGGAGLVVPVGQFSLGATAVTSTAVELNKLDALSRGSLLYGNASAVTTILTKGTANQVLTSDGTDISWAAAAGGGLLQTVVSEFNTSKASTSTSYVTTAHAVAITPSATSSKIYLTLTGGVADQATSRYLFVIFYKATSAIDDAVYTKIGVGADNLVHSYSMSILDSPSTTSETTYTIYMKSGDGSNVQYCDGNAKIMLTAMEIAG